MSEMWVGMTCPPLSVVVVLMLLGVVAGWEEVSPVGWPVECELVPAGLTVVGVGPLPGGFNGPGKLGTGWLLAGGWMLNEKVVARPGSLPGGMGEPGELGAGWLVGKD